ncbi:sensor histidine kinase [Pedobacter sandarakinus]|uniref:sensor histidine kinase n=1 Tax=Pedobacter sandarakinus TaxID=353156 RepID=UPI0022453DAC|nr:histidine kinase [Pedobacter sandarakinus]MCX2573877.1 histidine kinase [Pedobacter sandarakinus]
MKKYFALLIVCLPILSFGQFNFYKVQYRVSPLNSNCNVNLIIDKNTKWISYYNESNDNELTNNVFLSGANKITLQTRIHKDSVNFYRYSIIKADSTYLIKEAIPNQTSFRFPPKSCCPGYLVMDIFNGAAQDIKLKIYKTTDETKISTIAIHSQLKPIIILSTQLFTAKPVEKIYADLFKPLGAQLPQQFLQSINIENGNELKVNDSTKFMSIKIKNNGMNSIYRLVLTHYDGRSEEKVFSSKDWERDYLGIGAEYFRKPGRYRISISPDLKVNSPQNNPLKMRPSVFDFVVRKSEKTYSTKDLITYCFSIGLMIALITIIYIYVIKKRNKRILVEQERQKTTAQLQLNSVRSQLNPHFLFNALSGIQNLMNKNEMDTANKYLSKFARLTRNVLDDKELISLAQEKTLLDDYLQMEQLRFGFGYEIETEENLDLENIEIPSMLLQPFVENAVKHGISQQTADGKIIITFGTQEKNLIIVVSDNGSGFDTEKKYNGLGLQLSDNRIALLNSIYKENRFILEKLSKGGQTKIILTLTEWL